MKISKQKNYTVITAEEGKIFTDKQGNIVGKELYLGNIDSPDNYVEVEEIEKMEE